MSVLKGLVIAFSIYSAIPVPQFAWKEKDMKYMLCFFPWIGAVIGVIFYGFGWYCLQKQTSTIFFSFLLSAIPLLITGGFHLDGYMDTMDAMHSYAPRQRKLEILKDAHIGAFSVIMTLIYYLVYVGIMSEIDTKNSLLIIAYGFFIARCFSALSVIGFKNAKKDGMLFTFSSQSQKKKVSFFVIMQLAISVILLILYTGVRGGIAVVVSLLVFWYYKKKSEKEFGGITGDTAGWFVTICELSFVVTAWITQLGG